MYKIVIVSYKLYPESWEGQGESVFDLIYLLNITLQSLNSHLFQSYLAETDLEYGQIIERVLQTGGTKAQSLQNISSISKQIKESLEREVIFALSLFEIKPHVFIASQLAKRVWKSEFEGCYSADPEDFCHALQQEIGSAAKAERIIKRIQKLKPAPYDLASSSPASSRRPSAVGKMTSPAGSVHKSQDEPLRVHLKDLANLTDFFSLHFLEGLSRRSECELYFG